MIITAHSTSSIKTLMQHVDKHLIMKSTSLLATSICIGGRCSAAMSLWYSTVALSQYSNNPLTSETHHVVQPRPYLLLFLKFCKINEIVNFK